MPKNKKNDANAVKDIDKKVPEDEAQSPKASTLSEEDSISKSKPSPDVKNDHRFHKVVDGKDKATKVLYKQSNETRVDAVARLKETGWMNDNTQYHEGPNSREFHEGDSSKCPNCARYARKNDTGPNSSMPELTTKHISSADDVKKAWSTNPAGTSPHFELVLTGEGLVIPLISKLADVNEATALFMASTKFAKAKPELKVSVRGKVESELCPNAYEVKVSLSRDMRNIVRNINIKGWAPILLSKEGERDKGPIMVKPVIQVVYGPQEYKPESVYLFKDPFKLSDDDFKPEEDHENEGNDTTDESDK